MRKAIVLLSGGLDSTTALAIARDVGYEVFPLNVKYGQRHEREIRSAEMVAAHYHLELKRVSLKLPWGGSSLLPGAAAPPEGRSLAEMGKGIPSTYVPARNTFMLGLAASYAEAIEASAIFIGVNALDYSGYPDCRPEFIDAMQEAIRLGTAVGVNGTSIAIRAPLIQMSKREIVMTAKVLYAPVHMTWSCYSGGEKPCGKCDSCILREKGFHEAAMADPAL